MQTFLPFADFGLSARVLDMKRLGKQRVETYQIMLALLTNKGWIHHPVTHMWAGHELALLEYQRAITYEWRKIRGYKDTCWPKTLQLCGENAWVLAPESADMPEWMGQEDFHFAHQSNLLRKDPVHYGQYFHDVPDDLPYIYPVPEETEEEYKSDGW